MLKYEVPAPSLPDGSTYNKVSYQRSIDENTLAGNQEKFKKRLDEQIKTYNEKKGEPQKHAAAIRASQDCAKQLEGKVPAASCPPE